MKHGVVVAWMAVASVALATPPAVAQPCGHHGCGYHGRGHHHGCGGCPSCVAPPEGRQQGPADRVYDPDTVTTLKGSVTAVAVLPARGGRSGGTHVTLASDGAVTDVHMGPTWFLDQEGLKLAKGDALEVTGSLVELEGKAYLVAREVRKAATLYRLRDERGMPAWAGGPRRD